MQAQSDYISTNRKVTNVYLVQIRLDGLIIMIHKESYQLRLA